MTSTTLMIKTTKELRNDAKRVAQELGIPLTTIVNAYLKQFVREKSFSTSVYPVPRPEKVAEWEKAIADAERGVNVSGPFNTFEELKRHMDSVRARARRKAVQQNQYV